jgi:hypothetical protein
LGGEEGTKIEKRKDIVLKLELRKEIMKRRDLRGRKTK